MYCTVYLSACPLKINPLKPQGQALYFFYYLDSVRSWMRSSRLGGGIPYYGYMMLGSKDIGFYVFRTLMYIVGKPWSKQDV